MLTDNRMYRVKPNLGFGAFRPIAQHVRRVVLLALAVFGGGCDDTNFKGSGDQESTKPPAALSQALSFACFNTLTVGPASAAELKGKSNTQIKVTGEFCPAATGKLTILFIVDFSGSMSQNDPDASGGCGRLSAAKAIVNRMVTATANNPQAQISVGAVSFSNTANVSVPLTAISGFSQFLTAANFCGQNGSTNYAAAFSTAQSALAQATGPKAIYFISDGDPQTGNGAPGLPDVAAQTDGLNAAQLLRSGIAESTLNVLFLQPQAPISGFDPQSYLSQIAGDASRVRLAGNADALAAEIVQLALPKVELAANSHRLNVSAKELGKSANLEFETFKINSNQSGQYSFVSKPFTPFGEVGRSIENVVTITAQDIKGNPQSSQAAIKFSVTK